MSTIMKITISKLDWVRDLCLGHPHRSLKWDPRRITIMLQHGNVKLQNIIGVLDEYPLKIN